MEGTPDQGAGGVLQQVAGEAPDEEGGRNDEGGGYGDGAAPALMEYPDDGDAGEAS